MTRSTWEEEVKYGLWKQPHRHRLRTSAVRNFTQTQAPMSAATAAATFSNYGPGSATATTSNIPSVIRGGTYTTQYGEAGSIPFTAVVGLLPPSLPDPPVPPPIANAVSPEIASRATQRLVAASLRDAGFSSAHPDAVRWIEVQIVAGEFICRFFRHTFIGLKGDCSDGKAL
jgi:hypothetical protein